MKCQCRPGAASSLVVETRRGDIGAAEPFLDFGDIELVGEGVRRCGLAAEHFVEMGLSIPQSALYYLVQVFSLVRFRIATVAHPYEPRKAPRRTISPTSRAIERPRPN